jgi:hypothetical protein
MMKSFKDTAERMMTSILEMVECDSDGFDSTVLTVDEEVAMDKQLNREAPQNLVELCW